MVPAVQGWAVPSGDRRRDLTIAHRPTACKRARAAWHAGELNSGCGNSAAAPARRADQHFFLPRAPPPLSAWCTVPVATGWPPTGADARLRPPQEVLRAARGRSTIARSGECREWRGGGIPVTGAGCPASTMTKNRARSATRSPRSIRRWRPTSPLLAGADRLAPRRLMRDPERGAYNAICPDDPPR